MELAKLGRRVCLRRGGSLFEGGRQLAAREKGPGCIGATLMGEIAVRRVDHCRCVGGGCVTRVVLPQSERVCCAG